MLKLFSTIILLFLTNYSNPVLGQSLSQSCNQNYFRTFYANGPNQHIRDVTKTYDSCFVTVGNLGNNAYIFKVDRGGNIISQKFFLTSFNADFFKIANTSDSGFIVMAYSNYFIPTGGDLSIIRFDKSLNILWSNKYYVMAGAQSFYATQMDIVSLGGNGFAFCSNYDSQNILMTKIGESGSLIWQKKITTTLSRINTHSLTSKDGFVYLSYNTFNVNDATAYIAKFDVTDGNKIWSKSYITSTGNRLYFNKVSIKANNELVVNGIREEFPENYGFQTIIYLDTSGNPLRSASIVRPFKQEYSDLSDFTTMSNDGSLAGIARYDGSYYDTIYLASLDADLNLIWAKKYPYNEAQTIRRISNDFANEIFVFGEFTNSFPIAIQIMKTNSGGDIPGCSTFADQVQISPNILVSTNQSQSVSTVLIPPEVINFTASNPPPFLTIPICSGVSSCDTLYVTGIDTICSITNTVTFTAHRNTGCTGIVDFSLDTSYGKILSRTDSSVQIKFLKEGSVKLYGALQTSCKTLKDSITINIFKPSTSLNLGADIKYCDTSTSLLNARKGFQSYKWQDNSTDSILIATQAGTYYVSVKDYCNNEFTDTIKIEGYLSPVNFIIHDTAICLNQPTVLEPKSDFRNYLWSTGNITKKTLIQFPGIYSLQVTDNNGCTAKEFINVNSKNCLTIVYFPNTFTPNNDGKNDVFKTGVYGVLKQYHLIVYNRYGQKVFETSDPGLGWDGLFRGKKQNQDTYTWIANYQLEGKLPEQQNGTILLIR